MMDTYMNFMSAAFFTIIVVGFGVCMGAFIVGLYREGKKRK